jgi:hypothetical protein
MEGQLEDIRLVIKIQNNDPIELIDLTKSLVALANNFDRHSSKEGSSKQEKEAKLYVKEIRSGSVIVELMELATIGMIPFAENVNTIIDFATYFKSAVSFYLNGTGDNPELSTAEFKEFSTIVNPTAKDKGSQFNLSTTVNGNVTLNFNLNSNESNAIQNIFDREIKKLKEPSVSEEIEERVMLTFFQARSEISSKVGNKGIIESLSKKPMNIVFSSEKIKTEILHSDSNPLKSAYLVDVKIETINEKPSVYRILDLHEYFDLDEN